MTNEENKDAVAPSQEGKKIRQAAMELGLNDSTFTVYVMEDAKAQDINNIRDLADQVTYPSRLYISDSLVKARRATDLSATYSHVKGLDVIGEVGS